MPTKHPRIQFTPTDRTAPLLQELSRLTGKAPASIVRELLEEAAPALEMSVEAFRTLKDRPQEAQAAIHRLAARAHREISQATLDLDTSEKPGPKPGTKKGRGAANTG